MSGERVNAGPEASGYERSDARMRPLLISAGVLLILFSVSMAVSKKITKGLLTQRAQAVAPSPLEDFREPPAGPRLQSNPTLEIDEHRAREEAVLNGYDWIDRANGVVQLPIDRSMELLLERGLPQPSADPAPDSR